MIEVRSNFTLEEIPRLYELEKICFPEPIRWGEKDFAPALAASDVWVAEFVEDGCACGQIWNCTCNDTPNETREIIGFLSASVERRQGHIATVNVDPAHRGHGVAVKLVTAAQDEYRKRGFTQMFLEVGVDNPAQTLYFKLGYRVTTVRKKWYEDGGHCLYMIKPLTETI